MGCDPGEPQHGEGFCLVIQTGLWGELGQLEMTEGGAHALFQRQQDSMDGREDSGCGGPNRMASPSEEVSGSPSRG